MTYEQETLWLAGLFEGEGCFTTRRQFNEIRISLHMTDEDVVKKAAIAVGGASVRIHSRVRKPTHKPTFEFEILGDKAVAFGLRILPFMGQRRKARIEFLLERASRRLSRSERGKRGAAKRWGTKRDEFTLPLEGVR